MEGEIRTVPSRVNQVLVPNPCLIDRGRGNNYLYICISDSTTEYGVATIRYKKLYSERSLRAMAKKMLLLYSQLDW
jgi:hypothetical protein